MFTDVTGDAYVQYALCLCADALDRVYIVLMSSEMDSLDAIAE